MLIQINWNPDRRQLRNFGITMLGICIAAGALWGWRKTHSATPLYLGAAVGLAVLIVSVFLPPIGKLLYRGWMGIGLILGTVIAPIFVGLIYFAVITPIGLLMRLAGRDPLHLRKPATGGFWTPIEHRTDRRYYERQF